MDPATLALTLGGTASNMGGGFLNAFMTGRQNRLSRQWAEKMQHLQYQQQLDMWNKQNEYNHPKAQFERMTGSGFNPKTLFGQGDAGNSSPMTAPGVGAVSNGVPMVGDGLIGGSSTLMQLYDMENKNKELDIKEQEIALRHEQILNMRFDRGYKETMMPHQLDALKLSNRTSVIDQYTRLSEEQRKAMMHGINLQQGLVNIAKTFYDSRNSKKQNEYLDAQIENLKSQTSLTNLRITKGELWAPALRVGGAFTRKLEEALKNLSGPGSKKDPNSWKKKYNSEMKEYNKWMEGHLGDDFTPVDTLKY
jgi:hypothetical protein